MTSYPLDRTEVRDNFRFFHEMPLRWIDNDLYGHLNNARYYSLFENTIMYYLEVVNGLNPNTGSVRCFSAENGCRYHAPIKFPDVTETGLRVAHIGNSSVRYELGIFVAGADAVAATGFATEIFVDAQSERPTRIPDEFRQAMEKISVAATD